jgi:CxxC motif-containing protein
MKKKIIPIIVMSIAILIVLGVHLYEVTAQQSSQNTCPADKVYPITVIGEGKSGVTSLSPLQNAPAVINTPVGAQGLAKEKAIADCNKKLAEELSKNSKECFKHCQTVPQCSAQSTIKGPNQCNDQNADCSQITEIVSAAHNLLGQLWSPPLPIGISGTVTGISCTLKQTSEVVCSCIPQQKTTGGN